MILNPHFCSTSDLPNTICISSTEGKKLCSSNVQNANMNSTQTIQKEPTKPNLALLKSYQLRAMELKLEGYSYAEISDKLAKEGDVVPVGTLKWWFYKNGPL